MLVNAWFFILSLVYMDGFLIAFTILGITGGIRYVYMKCIKPKTIKKQNVFIDYDGQASYPPYANL